jgi:hypothetical protein
MDIRVCACSHLKLFICTLQVRNKPKDGTAKTSVYSRTGHGQEQYQLLLLCQKPVLAGFLRRAYLNIYKKTFSPLTYLDEVLKPTLSTLP